MTKFFKFIIFICFFSLLSACVFNQGGNFYLNQKDSCGFAVNQYTGQGLRWGGEFPIPFHIHKSVPWEAYDNFMASIDHWNIYWEEFLEEKGLESFPLFEMADTQFRYKGKPQRDDYNMLFFMGDDFLEYEGAGASRIQAFTNLSSNSITSKIQDTDILVNDDKYSLYYDEDYVQDVYLAKREFQQMRHLASTASVSFWVQIKQQIKRWFKFLLKPFFKTKSTRWIAKTPKVPEGYIDFPSLMIHELGHVPGLNHVTVEDIKNNLNEKDLDDNYSHRITSRNRRQKSVSLSSFSVMGKELAEGQVRRVIGSHDLSSLYCGYEQEIED